MMADEEEGGTLPDKEVYSEVGIETEEDLQSIDSNAQEKDKKRKALESWLNKMVRIKISDGRTLIGAFLCTDRERNIILGSCQEFVGNPGDENEEPRILGLAMVPGKHIVSIEIDIEHRSAHMFKPFS